MDITLPRRVITGVNDEGKSCIAFDGPPALVLDAGGSHVSWMWATDGTAQVPHDGSDPIPKMTTWFPLRGGTRLILETLAPGFELGALSEEESAQSMQAVEALDLPFNATYYDEAGVHSSDTIDYALIISGELCMHMEDGNEVTLRQGDCVVQTGVRHTWCNRSTEPCRVAFVIIGAERTSDPEAEITSSS